MSEIPNRPDASDDLKAEVERKVDELERRLAEVERRLSERARLARERVDDPPKDPDSR